MADEQQRPIRVQVPGHGVVEFPAGTSDTEMAEALTQLAAPDTKPGTSKEQFMARVRPSHPMAEFGKGVAKAFGRTIGNLASGAQQMFPGVNYTPADQARLEQHTAPHGTAQKVGYVAETVAEMALPTASMGRAALRAIPNQRRAGQAFQAVMSKAAHVPIDVSAPGNQALRIYQLSERGGTMPKAVRDFLKRVTDPEKGPMTYEEARDFASNISRLSADEYKRLPPAMQKEVHGLRVALNGAVKKAADSVGMGDVYSGAMKEYSQASKVRGHVDDAKKAALKYAIPATAGGVAANYLLRLASGRD